MIGEPAKTYRYFVVTAEEGSSMEGLLREMVILDRSYNSKCEVVEIAPDIYKGSDLEMKVVAQLPARDKR